MTSNLSEMSPSFPCDQCENIFHSSKEWMVHVREADNHSPICKTCDIEFKNFDNLRHHKRKYHFERVAPAGFVCDTCGKGCKTRELLNDHWNYVHKVEPGLNCNLCGRSCQNMLKLKKHTLMCLSRDPDVVEKERQMYEASVKKYETQTQHIYPIVNNRPSEVKENSEDTEAFAAIPRKHKMEYHETYPEVSDPTIADDENISNSNETQEEDYSMEVKEEYDDDVEEGQTGDDEMLDPSDYLFNQTINNDVKMLKSDVIKIETQPDIEPLVCNVKKEPKKRNKIPVVPKVCPFCAKEVKYLNGHIKEVHTETPPENHICNHCGKIFSKIKKLRGHIDAVHKVQPTMCDICSQEFKNLHALRGHKAKVHEIISEVTCPTCSKVFETRLKLYYHERAVHTLEQSKCPVCDKTYKNRNLLQKHIKVYHKEFHEAQKAYAGNSRMLTA